MTPNSKTPASVGFTVAKGLAYLHEKRQGRGDDENGHGSNVRAPTSKKLLSSRILVSTSRCHTTTTTSSASKGISVAYFYRVFLFEMASWGPLGPRSTQ